MLVIEIISRKWEEHKSEIIFNFRYFYITLIFLCNSKSNNKFILLLQKLDKQINLFKLIAELPRKLWFYKNFLICIFFIIIFAMLTRHAYVGTLGVDALFKEESEYRLFKLYIFYCDVLKALPLFFFLMYLLLINERTKKKKDLASIPLMLTSMFVIFIMDIMDTLRFLNLLRRVHIYKIIFFYIIVIFLLYYFLTTKRKRTYFLLFLLLLAVFYFISFIY